LRDRSTPWAPPSNAAFIAAYFKAYGGTAAQIDSTSAEAYSCGMLLEEVAATLRSAARGAGFTPKSPVIEISGICTHCAV